MCRVFQISEYIGEQAVYGTVMIPVAAIPDDILEKLKTGCHYFVRLDCDKSEKFSKMYDAIVPGGETEEEDATLELARDTMSLKDDETESELDVDVRLTVAVVGHA